MSDAAQAVFGDTYPLASRYVEVLATRGVEWGLIGPREVDRLWDRHVLNSVAVSGLIPPGVSVVDVGSGAGLPGLPLAILRPDLEVTLVEPLLRRSTFLTETLTELGLLDRVRVERVRAEDHHVRYDVVTSRALAPLLRLVPWCTPLMQPRGAILALKGSSAQDEIDAAESVLRSHRLRAAVRVVRAHPEAQPTSVVEMTRR